MKVISIMSKKGGVGKTTTAVNLGFNLTTVGKKVLIIDNDDQGNASQFLNRQPKGENPLDVLGTNTLLTSVNVEIKELIQSTEFERLDIIPTNLALLMANRQAMNNAGDINISECYKNALEQVKDEYDYVIFDNAPTFDISVINALIATDEIIVPIKVDRFSYEGLQDLLGQIENIIQSSNASLKEIKLLFTMYNNSKIYKAGIEEFVELLRNSSYLFNCNIFDTMIRRSVIVDKSTYERQPLYMLSKRCNPSKDYMELLVEVMKD